MKSMASTQIAAATKKKKNTNAEPPPHLRTVTASLGGEKDMSALGQKQTFAVQTGMSALHLIATVKADIALQDACSSRRH